MMSSNPTNAEVFVYTEEGGVDVPAVLIPPTDESADEARVFL